MVIVTYNRIDKLTKVIDSINNQMTAPKYVIIVDNASTDGTDKLLHQWKESNAPYEKTVITNKENTGGAGGFYTGLREAFNKDAEWIWVSDDDAYLKENALKEAKEFLDRNKDENISAICSKVNTKNGIDITHRRNIIAKGLKIEDQFVEEEKYQYDKTIINSFSYVGVLINKRKLGETGLPNKDFFIWFDDTEHSFRLSKAGEIYLAPRIEVFHDADNIEKKEITWKVYYGYRNATYTYKEFFKKRYFYYYLARTWVKSHYYGLIKREKAHGKMIRCAIKDGRKGKLGIHSIYKPGWTMEK